MILVFSIEEDNSTSDVLDWIDPFFRISKFGSSEYQHLQCGKKTVLLQPLNIYLCRLNKHLMSEQSWKNLRIAGKCIPLQRVERIAPTGLRHPDNPKTCKSSIIRSPL